MAISVFCGSSPGLRTSYRNGATATGVTLAQRGIEIIYGGGRVGLMGAVADAALAAGGRVTGVMPRSLFEREIAHTGLTALHVVETMHDRKTLMAELAEGFFALPGGAGTIEEIFEQWTWAQLGIHAKPCGFLNVDGYFEPLRKMIEKMMREGFMRAEYGAMIPFERTVEALLDHFQSYSPPDAKWSPQTHGQVRA